MERNVNPIFQFTFRPRTLIWAGLALAAVILGATSVYVVDQTEEAVVLTLGQYSRTEGPGMRFKLPFGLEESFNIPTKVVQKMSFGYEDLPATGGRGTVRRENPEESLMLTGDLNIVDIQWVIQYRITDPQAWLFNVEQREKTIQDISVSIINQLVGDRAILAVMGPERTAIEVAGQQMLNDRLARYGLGIQVTQVNLGNILPPRGPVQDAFEDVNIATQDMNRLINEGREAYNREIPAADGEAKRLIEVAQGYAIERVNKARGDIARFNSVLSEYRKNPEIMRTRLYYETMEALFSSGNTTLIDKALPGAVPLLNLNQGAAR